MRRYETVWVVNGDLPDEDVKATIDKFSRIITAQGGKIISILEWGRRKLAYKIAGTLRGSYVVAEFVGEPTLVQELERNYRIDDRVIRYLTVKKADKVDLGALEAEMAAKARELARLKEQPEIAAAEEGEKEGPPEEEASPETAESSLEETAQAEEEVEA